MPQTLDHVPAFVLGRRTDVLASNRLARAVLTGFDALPAPRRNLALHYLLDPEARERVGDWERIAAETVAVLRWRPAATRTTADWPISSANSLLTRRAVRVCAGAPVCAGRGAWCAGRAMGGVMHSLRSLNPVNMTGDVLMRLCPRALTRQRYSPLRGTHDDEPHQGSRTGRPSAPSAAGHGYG